MSRKTPLHGRHGALGARLMEFGGYEMPLNYGSQVAEHHAVRRDAGVFDVSHMGQVRVRGPRAEEFLLRLVMNDVSRLADGQALYTPMCRHDGGLLDDLIVTRLGEEHYFVVVNAGPQEKDFAHMLAVHEEFGFGDGATLELESDRWSMLALQGPRAQEVLTRLLPGRDWDGLGYFHVAAHDHDGAAGYVSRTGYTGEDGVELIFPHDAAVAMWDRLMEAGVAPCGLGARDTLRLEAGYLLSGQDFNEQHNPIEVTIGWACKEERAVAPVGAEAVAKMRTTKESRRLMGIEMQEKGIPRHDAYLSLGPMTISIGYVTSGTFSPTLEKGIGLALLSSDYKKPGTELQLKMRGKCWPVTVVRPPFVKNTSIRKG